MVGVAVRQVLEKRGALGLFGRLLKASPPSVWVPCGLGFFAWLAWFFVYTGKKVLFFFFSSLVLERLHQQSFWGFWKSSWCFSLGLRSERMTSGRKIWDCQEAEGLLCFSPRPQKKPKKDTKPLFFITCEERTNTRDSTGWHLFAQAPVLLSEYFFLQ